MKNEEARKLMERSIRNIIVAGALGVLSYGAFASDLRDRDFRESERFQKTNICQPANMVVQSLHDELRSLRESNNSQRQIEQLQREIRERRDNLSQTRAKLNKMSGQLSAEQSRLERLTHHMQEEIRSLEAEIAKLRASVDQKNRDIKKYEKEKNDCHGGLLGSFCRSKWKNKIEDAQNDIKNAQKSQQNIKTKISSLPGERDKLPAKIKQSKQMVSQLESKLHEFENMNPSIPQMENRIARLEQENREAAHAARELERQLDEAQYTLDKCRHMRVLANAYPLMLKQVEQFKSNPQTCASIDSLMQYANKEFEKVALQDAYNIACVNMNVQTSEPTEEINQPQQPVEEIIKLEYVIETPMGSDGNYKDDLRTADRQPVKIGTIGGDASIKQITFHVSYDIEKAGSTRMFDYLLIKDAQGKEIFKVAGSGEETITVNSSAVDVFFYSDGRGNARGVTIDDVEALVVH